jgi:CRISPR system Cascade subunit CasB
VSEQFIERLWKLERADLAELRRSLAFDPGTHAPSFRVVESYAMYAKSKWEADSYYLVAGLFALIERPKPDGSQPKLEPRNLGQSVAELYVARQKSESIEKRFIALLDADMEQLAYRLRQMIALLRDTTPIDWQTLLKDLRFWNTEKKQVQRSWAQGFYRSLKNAETTDAATETQAETLTETTQEETA